MTLATASPFVVAAYALGEASGDALDSVGSLDFTEVGTVGVGTCFGGNARDFEESENDRFSFNDSSQDFGVGDQKFMISAMVRLESKDQSYPTIFGKVDSGATDDYYLILRGGSTDRFEFRFGGTMVRAEDFGAPSTGVDYLIHAWHDPDANEIGISVNGVATTTTHTTGNTSTTRAVAIGDLGAYHDTNSGWDGLIREVVILKDYYLDSTERAEHYNGGDPIPFADWAGGSGNSVAFAHYYHTLLQGVGR